jgi:dihydrofolate reductase
LAQLQQEGLNDRKQSIDRVFIIGGATLYKETLELPSSLTTVDRILLTRILSPPFEECDVFLPDFQNIDNGNSKRWSRSPHAELQTWVGFDVPEGVQEERGVQYEFQMWTR